LGQDVEPAGSPRDEGGRVAGQVGAVQALPAAPLLAVVALVPEISECLVSKGYGGVERPDCTHQQIPSGPTATTSSLYAEPEMAAGAEAIWPPRLSHWFGVVVRPWSSGLTARGGRALARARPPWARRPERVARRTMMMSACSCTECRARRDAPGHECLPPFMLESIPAYGYIPLHAWD